ncbi:MAG: transcription-repair coupling factor, partial [Bacteroidetes bacterium]|nr:transcription-repair coupling factor [Bacteroidota bacterium]
MTPLFEIYATHRNVIELTGFLSDKHRAKIFLSGLTGSSRALVAAQCLKGLKRHSLIVLNDKEEAAYFYNDLAVISAKQNVLFFPSSYKRSVLYDNIDNESIVLRTETLKKIESETQKYIVVTYPEALCEKVISRADLVSNTLSLAVGEKVSQEFIIEVLNEYTFERTDFVYEPGQYAVRGSIIDIFSYSDDLPYRIDFFGSEVDSVRTFDITDQLSKERLPSISIVPNIQHQNIGGERISLPEFLGDQTVVWIKDLMYCVGRIDIIREGATERINNDEEDNTCAENLTSGTTIRDILQHFSVVEFGNRSHFNADKSYVFRTSHQPGFSNDFELLTENLLDNMMNGYTTFIMSESEKQADRLSSIFNDICTGVEFIPVLPALHEGFTDHDLMVCCYTDHQIFDRYHKYRLKSRFTHREAVTLQELTGLHPGDYVVHTDHGIGIFGGLETIELNGRMQETIRLVFKDNDILYVNIHSLHRLSKYKGSEGVPPKVYKLGSGAWQKLKQKTKTRIRDIARDLIELYARRKSEKGFRFSPDTYLNRELEASFIYEDTPDQVSATQAVKQDMESDCPMDRLVCGDVGFGKTEIAIRAAFKAVADSKQVAVLVPTTILALQHFQTFSERLKGYPCTVDYISRLKKSKQQKETITALREGRLDILIGTHRIIGKDVKFKDIGLLIIDEEQKFGVSVKEKLKALKVNVDTLTLTATPIPRTLQFSLMGARDLSIINTPPPNRYPITTELHTFNEDIIREAVTYEVGRDGQVFVINNRISNIYDIEALIKRICPNVKTAVVHGRMEAEKLENVMLGFIAGEYDVLVATTIIENGLDIPNANTIIIMDAENYGLSDLHQLRGRVGRSNRKAFCYLLAPPLQFVTPEARRRLRAIEEFSELGSGLNIALQDLDIRGAGNMLGAEQSGFIADIGFEAYQRILDEAILELKESDYRSLFSPETETKGDMPPEVPADIRFVADCVIDTDMELLFPEEYIENVSERIRLYRELDSIETEERLQAFEKQLTDRFGKLPEQSRELLNVVRLRKLAIDLGFEKIILKNDVFIGHFVSDPQSAYYRSPVFGKMLQYVQRQP